MSEEKLESIVTSLTKAVSDELGENYDLKDSKLLNKIVTRGINKAIAISHRKLTEESIALLEDEIISFSKTIYLQRGTEDVNSLSTSGRSSSFKNANEELRNSIIKSGKRVLY